MLDTLAYSTPDSVVGMYLYLLQQLPYNKPG